MKKYLYAILGVVLIVVLYFTLFQKGITVVVNNDSSTEITEIKLKYTGDSIIVPVLSSKSSKKIRINATGESSLVLEFRDPNTKEIRIQDLDVYFEKNYSGTIEISFDANGKLSWQNNIKLSWW